MPHYTEHKNRNAEQDYTYLYGSVTLNNTVAALHRAQTQQYTEHENSITPSRFVLIYASASHLISYTEAVIHRAQI